MSFKVIKLLVVILIIVYFSLFIFAQEKISCMVISFTDSTGSYAGIPVARFISARLASTSDFLSIFDSNYEYTNLSKALEYARSKSIRILVGGVVTESKVDYSSVYIPSPFGGVRVKSATATVSFQTDVRLVNDGSTIFSNSYSASETVNDVGVWAWTGWGYVDIDSASFLNSPMGKALNKAVSSFIQDMQKNKNNITDIINKQKGEGSLSSEKIDAKWAEETIKLDEYEFIKVYENNLYNLPKGTTFINGFKCISREKVVTDFISVVGRNVPFFPGVGGALLVDYDYPYEVPLCIDTKAVFWGSGSQFFVSLVNLEGLNSKSNIKARGVLIGFYTYDSTEDLFINAYLASEADVNYPWHWAAENFEKIGGNTLKIPKEIKNNKDLHIRIFITNKKLIVNVENMNAINMEIPSQLVNKFRKGNIVIQGRDSAISGLVIYKLKVFQEEEYKKENFNKIDELERKILSLGAYVKKNENYYNISIKWNKLFYTEDYKNITKTELFEDFMDLMDKLIIALNSEDVKVKINVSNKNLYSKQRDIILKYLGSLSNGNYSIKFIPPDDNSGFISFRITR